jgi:hypothetical protein
MVVNSTLANPQQRKSQGHGPRPCLNFQVDGHRDLGRSQLANTNMFLLGGRNGRQSEENLATDGTRDRKLAVS